MMKGRDLSHINSMADLRCEQQRVQEELAQSHEAIGQLTNAIPARAMGATLSWVVSSVVQAVVSKFDGAAAEAPTAAVPPTPAPESIEEEAPQEKPPLKEEFKTAGIETVQFAVGKALEILLKR